MAIPFARRLAAEAVGAFILTFFGGAAAIMATGNPVAGLLVPLAFGLSLFTAINLVGPISGAHVNPTVTLALALRGRFAWRDVPAYCVAQLVGGLVAGAVLFFTYGNQGVHAGLGTTHVPAGASTRVLLACLLAEALGTFLLASAVIALTDSKRGGTAPVATGIGLSLAVSLMAFGGLTGGSFNFARTLGPEIANALAHGTTDWPHIWIYLLGPVLGAFAAAYLNRALTGDDEAADVVTVPEQSEPVKV
jgi:glycerol uptake facilitator protein